MSKITAFSFITAFFPRRTRDLRESCIARRNNKHKYAIRLLVGSLTRNKVYVYPGPDGVLLNNTPATPGFVCLSAHMDLYLKFSIFLHLHLFDFVSCHHLEWVPRNLRRRRRRRRRSLSTCLCLPSFSDSAFLGTFEPVLALVLISF